ncbi:MAG: hypothetical protein E6314_24105, partial [Enterobacter sp.]|nr:hypothetical protein [Enterobacter sp.]MDU7190595.1 hypothetical protein [Enterobacter sp.]
MYPTDNGGNNLNNRGKPMNSSTNAVKRWWYIMPIVFITYSLAYL